MSKSIVTAPLSERMHFVDYASCVVTKNGCWSLFGPDPARMRPIKFECLLEQGVEGRT